MAIAILMSTFNGEKYIDEQIESIIQQTYTSWNLFIRDDGSTDHTRQIINKWINKDDRVHYINDTLSGLGPAKSFISLLNQVDADYYFFADQDDYWEKNKIEIMLANIDKTPDTPSLVYCSLKCTDENLNPEVNDFENLMGKFSGQNRFIGNDMPGCIMLINKKLRDITINNFDNNTNIIMHDWWIALIAEVFGNVRFIDQKLIKYRQHNNNSVGAGHKGNSLRKAMHKDVLKKQEKLVLQTYLQTKEFYRIFNTKLSYKWNNYLTEFVESAQRDWFYRLKFFNKYELHGSSKLRTLAYKYFFVFKLHSLLLAKERK